MFRSCTTFPIARGVEERDTFRNNFQKKGYLCALPPTSPPLALSAPSLVLFDTCLMTRFQVCLREGCEGVFLAVQSTPPTDGSGLATQVNLTSRCAVCTHIYIFQEKNGKICKNQNIFNDVPIFEEIHQWSKIASI